MHALAAEPTALRVLRALQGGAAERTSEPATAPRENEKKGARTRDVLSGCMTRLSSRATDSFERGRPSTAPPSHRA